MTTITVEAVVLPDKEAVVIADQEDSYLRWTPVMVGALCAVVSHLSLLRLPWLSGWVSVRRLPRGAIHPLPWFFLQVCI
jgi:hypothetical protein